MLANSIVSTAVKFLLNSARPPFSAAEATAHSSMSAPDLLSESCGPPEGVWQKWSCRCVRFGVAHQVKMGTLFSKSWSTSTCKNCGNREGPPHQLTNRSHVIIITIVSSLLQHHRDRLLLLGVRECRRTHFRKKIGKLAVIVVDSLPALLQRHQPPSRPLPRGPQSCQTAATPLLEMARPDKKSTD